MAVYESVVVLHPTQKEKDDGKRPKIIGPVETFWAPDEKAAATIAAKYVPDDYIKITDRIEVQREIIDDIERHRVRAMVIWKFGWSQEDLDRIKADWMSTVEGIGSTYLDGWIAGNCEPIEQHGEYVLMWRKGIARP